MIRNTLGFVSLLASLMSSHSLETKLMSTIGFSSELVRGVDDVQESSPTVVPVPLFSGSELADVLREPTVTKIVDLLGLMD